MGDYIVEIHEPRKLAELATSKMQETSYDFVGGIEGVIVEYNKGEEFHSLPGQLELARLIYSQKPRVPYEKENEFRLVIVSRDYLGDHFGLDLNRNLDFAKRIENI